MNSIRYRDWSEIRRSTCRDGFMRDFYVVVPEDLTACGSEERQQSSMYNLDHYFAIVTNRRVIVENWESNDGKPSKR